MNALSLCEHTQKGKSPGRAPGGRAPPRNELRKEHAKHGFTRRPRVSLSLVCSRLARDLARRRKRGADEARAVSCVGLGA
jgi:hypothetical protein